MKKIILFLFVFSLGLLVVGCDEKPIVDPPEPTTATVSIFVDGQFKEDKEVAIGSTIDFELDDDNYFFLGWYDVDGENQLDGTVVTGDIELFAKTIAKGTKYKITYHLDDAADFTDFNFPSEYECGKTTTLVAPVRPLNYEFGGWLLDGVVITEIPDDVYGPIDLYDSWIDNNTYHSITYNAEGATSYSEEKAEKVMEGEEYTFPYPIKEGYYFRGWYTDQALTNRIYKVTAENTEDITLYAKFAVKTAADTYVSFMGDSISTFHGYIPEDAGAYYPTFIPEMTADQTYFLQVCKGMGYNFLVNNSYSGSRLSSDVYSEGVKLPAGISDYRVGALGTDEHDPDILIVHMGTNEYSQGVDKYTFQRAIITYCKKVRALYDDVEIYFCLHPANGYGSSWIAVREAYNEIIIKMSDAEHCNYGVLDLTKCWDQSNYAVNINSNAHPSIVGFKKMADEIIKELKETHNY